MPMINDMEEPQGPFELQHFLHLTGVVSLPPFRIERRDAEIWATRDCKFLIYDADPEANPKSVVKPNDDISAQGSADREDDTLQESNEQRVDRPSSDKGKGKQAARSWGYEVKSRSEAFLEFSSTLGPNYGPLLCGNPAHKTEADCTREKHPQCGICSRCPEFPHDRKPRNFRLFRPRDEFPDLFRNGLPSVHDICTHYLAVSYCWPPQQKDDQGQVVNTPRSYKVRDLDGSVRDNRALDDVLDRAVDVANRFGLRMIWIDQECLPQPPQDSISPDKEDKELGIQAMDIIYNRALVTGGLQDVIISNQLQLETILGLATGRKPIRSYRELDIVLELFDKVKADRWYTRAWVIQEAVSAGDNLCLIFRRGPGLSVGTKPRIPTVRGGLPKHSLESNPRGQPSDVVCLMVQEFRNIIEAAKIYVGKTAFNVSIAGHSIYRDGRLRPDEQAIVAAEALHPVFWKPKHRNFRFGAFGATAFGIRPTVDAAGALTLLGTRGCYRHEDRIAIMANMCGYEFRLNPKVIAEYCNSLRVALLALAILNCDFSLLIPEMYAKSLAANEPDNADLRLLQGWRPGWVHPFDIDFQFLKEVTIRGFNIPRVQDRDARPGIIGFPAYLWEVSDKPIDMSTIKVLWAADWLKLKCLRTEIPHQKDEDEDAFKARSKAINARENMPDAYPLLKQELAEKGFISNDSPFWNGIECYAGTANFKLVLMADRMENSLKYQIIFSQIFFSILRFLFDQAETDARAQGVADCIWQSMRVDVVDEDHSELPDNVCEALFQHPAVQQTPFQIIKLDKTLNDMKEYHQIWLFDRIMTHGSLYVGRYVPEPGTGRSWRVFLGEELEETLKNNEFSAEETWEYIGKTVGIQPAEGSLMERQADRLLSMHICAADEIADYFEHEHDLERRARRRNIDMDVKPGAMIAFQQRVAGALAGDTEARRAEELFSVFDVDGPCTIAVPHDPAWEMIPHPSPRSMSACWVVKVIRPSEHTTMLATEGSSSAGTENSNRGGDDEDSTIRVLNKVKGAWPIMQIPPTERYIVADLRKDIRNMESASLSSD